MPGFEAPNPGDAGIRSGSQEASKRSEAAARAGKASPPPGRGADSQLTREPRATPDCAPLRLLLRRPSQGRTRFPCKSLPQAGVWGLLGSPEPTGCSQGFRALLPLARFEEVGTSPWHPRLHARTYDPSPCSETASSISSRPEKGRGPGHPLRSSSRGPHQTPAARTLRLLQSFRAVLSQRGAGRGLLP